MIKKIIRFSSYALAFIGLGGVSTSCKDDDGELCYRCTWTETYGETTYNYSTTYCLADAQVNYPGITKDEFVEYMTNFADYNDNGVCKKRSLQ